jgi:hypothetical protein
MITISFRLLCAKAGCWVASQLKRKEAPAPATAKTFLAVVSVHFLASKFMRLVSRSKAQFLAPLQPRFFCYNSRLLLYMASLVEDA